MAAELTECPKCGHKGANPDQCDRCGIIFDRMHTVLDTRPLGAHMAAAREAYIAQRQSRNAGAPPPPASPSVFVAHDARTVVEVPRVVSAKAGLSGPAGALDRVNPHASTVPAISPVAPAPLERIGVEVVPRTEQHTTRNFLLFVLIVVGVLYGWHKLSERRERQLAAATQEVAAVALPEPVVEAPALQANDVVQGAADGVDADYLAIATRTLLQDVRAELATVKDPAAAATSREAAVVRVGLLRRQLPNARLTPLQRSAYGHGLDALSAYLEEAVPRGLERARATPGTEETLDPTLVRAAEHEFSEAARAPVRGAPGNDTPPTPPEATPAPTPAPEAAPTPAPTPAPAAPTTPATP